MEDNRLECISTLQTKDAPYGVCEITLRDPDGNKIRFGRNLD